MLKEELRNLILDLYHDESKHSIYQSMPIFVQESLDIEVKVNQEWRGDVERYNYLVKHVDFNNKTIMDIGANTGYFSLNIAKHFAKEVIAYEPNENHGKVIKMLADFCKVENLKTKYEGVAFDNLKDIENSDILLHFNVMHHAGHDFDSTYVEKIEFLKKYSIDYLKQLRTKTKKIIYQMGYNWGGNKKTPIFPEINGAEMIKGVEKLCNESGWKIESIGLSKRADGKIIYEHFAFPLKEEVLKSLNAKQEGLSEFYKRPIFILS